MSADALGWLIFCAPLAAFLLIVLVTGPAGQRGLSAALTIAGVGVAFIASLFVLFSVMAAPGHELSTRPIPWLTIGQLELHIGLAVDSLTALMLVVVTSVSLLVQVYSTEYMRGDPGYSRYYASMALFTASMLGLVLADNLLQMYVFWELVGLCSYLLIGFWFRKPSAAAAAKKAFVVTRFGDLGFLLALLGIYALTGTFSINELFEHQNAAKLMAGGFLGLNGLTWVTLGLFAGAVGKSAQFPLHVWLPDAMEGPTPVSALIHAATMVAAGVYLVGRMLPLFHQSPETMGVVAFIGAFTAIIAAGLALVVNDIKRVMAYSTVSQLGYMMLALGLGGYAAAFFHLMNHAFFKALLFLGSGSVSHGVQGGQSESTFDMRYMGGLKRYMPVTFWTLFIASLSLAGIPPLSGFWSKDEILGLAQEQSFPLFLLALVTVFMTAFYVFRMLIMTFGGHYRGGADAEAEANRAIEYAYLGPGPLPVEHAGDDHGDGAAGSGHGGSHHSPHESPWAMTATLVVLAVPAVCSGFINLPGAEGFAAFLTTHRVEEALGARHLPFDPVLALVSTFIALAGIWLAWQMYGSKAISAETFGRALGGMPYRVLSNKYGLDFLYERLIVEMGIINGFCLALAMLDRYVVDGVVNGVGQVTRAVGAVARRAETGQVQGYGLAIVLGVLVLAITSLVRG